MTTDAEDAKEVKALVEQLRPLLAGKSPIVQAGALAELVAINITSHQLHPLTDTETREVWMGLLKLHAAAVARFLARMRRMDAVPEGERS